MITEKLSLHWNTVQLKLFISVLGSDFSVSPKLRLIKNCNFKPKLQLELLQVLQNTYSMTYFSPRTFLYFLKTLSRQGFLCLSHLLFKKHLNGAYLLYFRYHLGFYLISQKYFFSTC